jgi:hypothetical protein
MSDKALNATNKIVITIALDPTTGQLDISGPLQDGILFLGMLEAAKAIHSKLEEGKQPPTRQRSTPNIVVPTLNPPGRIGPK